MLQPRSIRFLPIAVLAWVFFLPGARAQYIAPGDSVLPSLLPEEKSFSDALEKAPWRLGRVRLSPWAGLRDIAYVTGSAESGDLTATGGAGLRAYTKTGKNVVWAAHVLPEYVWWQNDEAKRGLNGRYGLGFFGYFNRLEVETSFRREQRQAFFSSEIQELATSRVDSGNIVFSLKLVDNVALYGRLQRSKYTSQEAEGSVFSLLDREEEGTRIGMSYRAPSGWSVGVGFEDKSVDFVADRDLSHDGTSGFLDLGYTRGRLAASASLGRESLTPREGSIFTQRDVDTGAIEISWKARSKIQVFSYGRRQLRYSVSSSSTSILVERFGMQLRFGSGRGNLSLLVEAGEDEFTARSGEVGRLDEVVAVGGGIGFGIGKLFKLDLRAVRTEYDSSDPGFDRDVTTWGLTVELSELRRRLSLGENERVW